MEYIKSIAVVAGTLLAIAATLSFVDAHAADLSKIKIKQPKIHTYTVNGKEVNAAQAMLDALNGGTVSECKQVELEMSASGTPHFKTK